ncbi:hypothetical protein BKA70DRAFT_2603 [Coprinopsis sp. MPI-PUGE-AT-0042]|nr:hypothetical protein BKA70DRAFT_2603 [Coprinopsis sp. MPI-PUGE-AT-0042]
MFPNASQVAINGGTFYEINTRDAYFDQPWGPNAHVNINVVGNVYPLYRIASTSAQETKALWRNSLLRSGQPNSFSRVEAWLEAMSHYLAPVSEKSFRTLRRHLDDIQSLSSFSRTLYEISNGCAIDRIVKRRIEMQLQGCAQMLEKIHRRVVALPLWWIFLIKFVYGETFAEWLTDGRDPELQDIENDLGKEIQLFGKCIKSMQCLEGWPWGPQMWCSLTAQISFSAGLSNFLKTSGPSWIRDIIVEELIILEPIKGSPWSVPLVFVETIEDIHGFVQAGSQNTISSPYIEARQYQLDDSATNAEVDENSLCDYLEHKRILEVTICIRAPAEMKQDRCPGCGRLRDMLSEESTWVRW